MSTAKQGNTVSVHYRGTLANGEMFDSSYDRGEPIQFKIGEGMMIQGFNDGVLGMSVGETRTINIEPEKAYGQKNEQLIRRFPKVNFPENYEFKEGDFVQAQGQDGQTAFAKIVGILQDEVDLDFNHPLAGEDLTFEVELVDITN